MSSLLVLINAIMPCQHLFIQNKPLQMSECKHGKKKAGIPYHLGLWGSLSSVYSKIHPSTDNSGKQEASRIHSTPCTLSIRCLDARGCQRHFLSDQNSTSNPARWMSPNPNLLRSAKASVLQNNLLFPVQEDGGYIRCLG